MDMLLTGAVAVLFIGIVIWLLTRDRSGSGRDSSGNPIGRRPRDRDNDPEVRPE